MEKIKHISVDELIPFPDNKDYSCNKKGQVFRTCRRQRSKTGRKIIKHETILLKGSIDKYGYKTYRMLIDGKKKHIKGHRIIATTFLGKSQKPCVNHINGIKSDNRLENLEWVTVAENNKHAIDSGLWNKNMAIYKRKIHQSDYISINLMHRIAGISRRKIADMNNVSRSTIDTIINKTDKLLKAIECQIN